MDALSLLLSMANVTANSDVLVLDMVGGLVTGAVAERLGGMIHVLFLRVIYIVTETTRPIMNTTSVTFLIKYCGILNTLNVLEYLWESNVGPSLAIPFGEQVQVVCAILILEGHPILWI